MDWLDSLMVPKFFVNSVKYAICLVILMALCNFSDVKAKEDYGKDLVHTEDVLRRTVNLPVNNPKLSYGLGGGLQLTLGEISLGVYVWHVPEGAWISACLTLPANSKVSADWNKLRIVSGEALTGTENNMHIASRRLLRLNLHQPVYGGLSPPPDLGGQISGAAWDGVTVIPRQSSASFTLLPWREKRITLARVDNKSSGVYHLGFFVTPVPKSMLIQFPEITVDGQHFRPFRLVFKSNPDDSEF